MTDPLALRAAEGDPDAWREITRVYAPMLHAIAYREFRLFSGDAEDAIQETWVTLLRQGSRVENLPAFLTLYCRRRCLDRIRARHRLVPWSGMPEIEEGDPREAREFADDVIAALDALGPAGIRALAARLPGQQRRALAAWAEYKPLKDIAAELGTTVGAVKSHLSRARAALLRELERPQEKPAARPACELAAVYQAAGLLGVPAARVRGWERDGVLRAARCEDGRMLIVLADVLRMRARWARRLRRTALARAVAVPPEVTAYRERRAEFIAWLEEHLGERAEAA